MLFFVIISAFYRQSGDCENSFDGENSVGPLYCSRELSAFGFSSSIVPRREPCTKSHHGCSNHDSHGRLWKRSSKAVPSGLWDWTSDAAMGNTWGSTLTSSLSVRTGNCALSLVLLSSYRDPLG